MIGQARALDFALGLVLLMCVRHVMCDDLSRDDMSRDERSSHCSVDTNGCSIPGNLPFFFKGLFTSVCNKHDVCYGCGQMHGWSRSACDTAFKADMYARCKSYAAGTRKRFLGGGWVTLIKYLFKSKLSKCKDAANVYYNGVAMFGHLYYVKNSPAWCQNHCVKPLGQP